MKLLTTDGEPLMDVRSLRRSGNALMIEGRIMGALPVRAMLTPEEARAALRLLTPRLMLFLLTIVFRRSK